MGFNQNCFLLNAKLWQKLAFTFAFDSVFLLYKMSLDRQRVLRGDVGKIARLFTVLIVISLSALSFSTLIYHMVDDKEVRFKKLVGQLMAIVFYPSSQGMLLLFFYFLFKFYLVDMEINPKIKTSEDVI